MAVIREAGTDDAAGISRVHVDAWRATYPGIVPDAFLDAMSYGESEARWLELLGKRSRRSAMFVAELPGVGVVGFASGGTRREKSHPEYDGELYTLYLLAEFRGEGLGGRLLRAVAGRLPSVGCRAMLAWVMAKNHPSRRFYEAVGGTLLGSGAFEIEGEIIEEVAYGWDDVRSLMKALA